METLENADPVQFSLKATDVDTPETDLTITITSLPDPALGTLLTTEGIISFSLSLSLSSSPHLFSS